MDALGSEAARCSLTQLAAAQRDSEKDFNPVRKALRVTGEVPLSTITAPAGLAIAR